MLPVPRAGRQSPRHSRRLCAQVCKPHSGTQAPVLLCRAASLRLSRQQHDGVESDAQRDVAHSLNNFLHEQPHGARDFGRIPHYFLDARGEEQGGRAWVQVAGPHLILLSYCCAELVPVPYKLPDPSVVLVLLYRTCTGTVQVAGLHLILHVLSYCCTELVPVPYKLPKYI